MTTDHRLSPHEPAGPPQGRIPQCAARRYSSEHAAFYDTAKAHARVLRREAIDAFWAAIAGRIRQVLQAARAAVTVEARRPHQHHGRA